ncbi:hypothetical protein TK50_05255 [Micromonospora haikouensis]|uniref:HNH endonuclease n=1 Tax=Micromonospora haikouensis TaxID=686309 RepID=A0A0D0X1D8_9ACTN|nr:hypothetical protein TK50_05255 [Micromonospora haikouensis]
MLEVRPGVYQKNAQIAHIYGVKPKAARYRAEMTPEERDSFANLLLLCLAHHEEVDGDELRYSPQVLKKWKVAHEGENNAVLNRLIVPSGDVLMNFLAEIATPPLDRLEEITKRLEETGTASAETVRELKQIIAAMSDSGVDTHTARALAYSAEIFSSSDLRQSAQGLAHAADVLPGILRDMQQTVNRLSQFH